jgi:antitoxin component of MazEF toxin-antitoxin module
MTKTLVKHGNSLALVIDKPILDLLKIDGDTPLDVTTDGKNLLVSPVDAKRKKRFDAVSRRLRDQWSDAFKKLAE